MLFVPYENTVDFPESHDRLFFTVATSVVPKVVFRTVVATSTVLLLQLLSFLVGGEEQSVLCSIVVVVGRRARLSWRQTTFRCCFSY